MNRNFVVFLYNQENDDCFAYFPNSKYSEVRELSYTSYSIIGQHGGCSPEYAKKSCICGKNEYKDLLDELIRIGYNDLVILNERLRIESLHYMMDNPDSYNHYFSMIPYSFEEFGKYINDIIQTYPEKKDLPVYLCVEGDLYQLDIDFSMDDRIDIQPNDEKKFG